MSEAGDPGTRGGVASGLHGRPTARELVDAVGGFLRDQLEPEVGGALRYQVRIAVRALEVVARELELGPSQEVAHRARLAALGMADEAALAAAIRSGRLDDQPALVVSLRADARDRLLVANPGWLPADRA
jgi:hypothetical protein